MSGPAIDLTGQVAIVTGGGGGIGQGAALALAKHGARVAVADISLERADATARLIEELGQRSLAVVTDVTDTDQIREMVARTDAEFGRIDILVNNAGGVTGRPFLDQSERSWRKHIDINFVSMLAATSAVVPIMIREGRGGSIVNVSSIEAERAAPLYAVYAACKAGMNSFTRTLALELADHGVRVNCIAPDHTATPGTRGARSGSGDPSAWLQRTPSQADALNRMIPLRREGDVAECGDAIVFLVSEMARYITGVTLPVDGGTWASGGWVRGKSGKWILQEGWRLDDA